MLGYIFDFDGVIVDSMSLHLRCWENAYKQLFDKNLINPQRLAGMDSKRIAQILCEELGVIKKASDLVALKRYLTKEMYPKVDLLPGARQTIELLTQKGIPFGICSNATREFIDAVLRNKELTVDTIVSVESTSTPKPHPAPYVLTSKLLGFKNKEFPRIAGFEDSRHGMRSIQKAGLFGIGISSFHNKEELISCGAKLVFNSLGEAIEHESLFS